MVVIPNGLWQSWLERDNQLVAVYSTLRVENSNGTLDLAAFIPDRNWPISQLYAVVHRVGREMPAQDPDTAQHFEQYAKSFILKYFDPVTTLDESNTKTWLDGASYSKERKLGLATLRTMMDTLESTDTVAKCFGKDEDLKMPKHLRGIMSYSDESKALLGPFISASDHSVFTGSKTAKWFVKGTDPRTWPKRLFSIFGLDKVMETDFSSFEAHHQGVYARVIKFWLMHMLRNVCTVEVRSIISKMMAGINVMEFKTLTAYIPERLMSGALWTSSSNGVLNLLIMSYLVLRSKHPNASPAELLERVDSEFRGIFEGDDGLTLSSEVDESLIQRMGLVLKFKKKNSFNDAHFCGITCPTPSGNGDVQIITNPIDVIRKFFALPIKFRRSDRMMYQMLRAKALSYAYLYFDVPIIGELCDKVLYFTRSFNLSKTVLSETGTWYRNYVSKGLDNLAAMREKGPASRNYSCDHPLRHCMHEHFGISPEEQIRIENEIRNSDQPTMRVNLTRYSTLEDMEHGRFLYHDVYATDRVGLCTGDDSTEHLRLHPDPHHSEAILKACSDERNYLSKRSTAVRFEASAYNYCAENNRRCSMSRKPTRKRCGVGMLKPFTRRCLPCL